MLVRDDMRHDTIRRRGQIAELGYSTINEFHPANTVPKSYEGYISTRKDVVLSLIPSSQPYAQTDRSIWFWLFRACVRPSVRPPVPSFGRHPAVRGAGGYGPGS